MTLRYAGLVSRGAALLVDLVLLAFLVGSIGWLTQQLLGVDPARCPPVDQWWQLRRHACVWIPYVVPAAALALPLLYRLLFWTVAGRTPGMAMLGLRLLRADGGKVGLVTAAKRLLAYGVTMMTLGIGFLMMLVTRRRQALHDLLARTVVVYDWGTTPRDRARLLGVRDRLESGGSARSRTGE